MTVFGKKDEEKLTDGIESGDNAGIGQTDRLPSSDPRIVALVQFLARRAAKRDFEQLIQQSQRAGQPDDDKGRIQ